MSRRPLPKGRALRALPAPAIGAPLAPPSLESDVLDDDGEISVEELREFLSADLFEVPANPQFKNRLREKLWELIESRAFGFGPSGRGEG